MRKTILIALLLAAGSGIQAQERIAREEALKYAFLVCTDLKQAQNTPIPTDPDVKRPVALKDGEYGGMILPETKLAQSLAKVGEEVTSIGQLWLHKLVPLCEGQPVPQNKLRLVTVSSSEGQATLPLCALGIRKTASGDLELVVYGKDKEPLLKSPVKSISTTQDNPIEISAERRDDGGVITVNILGKHQATFMVTDPEKY